MSVEEQQIMTRHPAPHFEREPDVTTLIVERETMFVVETTSTRPANPRDLSGAVFWHFFLW